MDEPVAQGEIRVWRGASIVAWLSFVVQIGTLVGGGGYGVIWATTAYRDILHEQSDIRAKTVDLDTKTDKIRDDRVRDHREVMQMFCEVMKKMDPRYLCLNNQRSGEREPGGRPGEG